MVIFYPKLSIYGDKFSPNKFETIASIALINKNEVGEISKIGRYKNKPYPYGSAWIIPPEDINDETSKLLWLIDVYINYRSLLIRCGADDIAFHIDIDYDKQCNFHFEAIVLEKLGNLKIPLTISCWDKTIEE